MKTSKNIIETANKISLFFILIFLGQSNVFAQYTGGEGSGYTRQNMKPFAFDILEESVVIDNQFYDVNENEPRGTVVAQIVANGTNLEYKIISGNVAAEAFVGNENPAFAIRDSGYLIVADSLKMDFEIVNQYQLKVQVNDGKDTADAIVMVNINNMYEAPIFLDTEVKIDENLPNGQIALKMNAYAPDYMGELSFSIMDGNLDSAFKVIKNRLVVNNSKALDYEKDSVFIIIAGASDGVNTTYASMKISLNNLNDNPPDIDLQPITIPEHSRKGAEVTIFTGIDADKDSLTYQIIGGNEKDIFELKGNSLRVKNPKYLDFETNPVNVIQLKITDGKYMVQKPFTINLKNINDNPPTIENKITTIDENTPDGEIVTNLTSFDIDKDVITYTIKGGNIGKVFEIIGEQLIVANSRQLDYEKRDTFNLTIVANDGKFSAEGNIKVALKNINDNPPTFNDATFECEENTPYNTEVYTLQANDPDSMGTVSYKITGGNTDNPFRISGDKLIVYNSKVLDYEKTKTLSLTISASDGLNADEATITCKLKNINDNPPKLEVAAMKFDENPTIGQEITNLAGTDPDGDAITYSIDNADFENAFDLSGSSLKITDPTPFDYEKNPVINLVINVSDGKFNTKSKVTLNLNNLNDNPPTLENAEITINENTKNETTVLLLNAVDADNLNNLVYSISEGNSSDAFKIDGNKLVVNNQEKLDYETTQSFNLKIKVTDGQFSDEATITVNLKNLNDNPPTFKDQTVSIDENPQYHQTVVVLKATDPDNMGDLTYYVSEGNSGYSFTTIGDTLKVHNSKMFDYEKTKNFTIKVRVSDGLNKTYATITVNLNNVNDNSPSISLNPIKMDENPTNGQEVTSLTGTDPDNLGGLTYSITAGNESNAFKIDGNSLLVADASQIDYEKVKSFNLKIQVSDGKYQSDTDFPISINNLNDNKPTFEQKTHEITIDENAALNTTIASIEATDADNDKLTYKIDKGNENEAFKIAGTKIVVADASKVDYETTKEFNLNLSVNDGEFSDNATIKVKLNNLNDNTPVLELAEAVINENTPTNAEVTTFTATDADNLSPITYSIVLGNTGNAFKMEGNKLLVADSTILDYEKIKQFELVIKASDGELSVSPKFILKLKNLNDNPPVFENQTAIINENTENGTSILTLKTTDADNLNTPKFTIETGNTGNAFKIDGNKLIVASKEALDYEKIQEFQLKITANDGTYKDNALITVKLKNLNDNPPVFKDITVNLDENSAYNTEVVELTATDAENDPITFKIKEGNPEGAFRVSGKKILVVNSKPLDFEKNKQLKLTLTANDTKFDTDATLTINLRNKNDNAPELNVAEILIEENLENGTVITELNGTDADNMGALTYSIAGGNDLGIFELTGNKFKVANNENLDYEKYKSFIVKIQVSDGEKSSITNLSLKVKNMNDIKPVIEPQTASINENTDNETTVISLKYTDADQLGKPTFKIESGNTNQAFKMDENKLIVAKSEALDYEKIQKFELKISINDGQFTDQALYTVSLNDINDNAPVFNDKTITIEENLPKDAVATTLTATDSDKESAITYSLKSGNTGNTFKISNDKLLVANPALLDFEKGQTFELAIQASDGKNTDNATITIKLKNINDNAPKLKIFPISIDNTYENGNEITQLNATDADNDTDFTYSIKSGNNGAFKIEGNSLKIADIQKIDFTTKKAFNLVISVSDGKNTTDVNFNITVK